MSQSCFGKYKPGLKLAPGLKKSIFEAPATIRGNTVLTVFPQINAEGIEEMSYYMVATHSIHRPIIKKNTLPYSVVHILAIQERCLTRGKGFK